MNEFARRIEEQKHTTLTSKPTLAVDRMKILEEEYRKKDEQTALRKRANGFVALCRNMPLCIEAQELIVGALGTHINTAQLYPPESSIQWLKDELDTIDQREQDPFQIQPSDQAFLRDKLTYWENKTVSEKIDKALSSEAKAYLSSNVFFIQKEMGYGHCLADYEQILHKGLKGMAEEVEAYWREEKDDKKKLFYECSLSTLHGALILIERYSKYADALAGIEKNEQRKQELKRIAKICHKLTKKHAETFHEALQCIWFIQLMIHLESDGTGVSFGRLDQYLFPYYQYSVDQHEKQETLQMLLDMFWIKTNHLLKCRNRKAASLWSGYIMNQNITIGGQLCNGCDASNALTMMCLESQRTLTMKEPQFSLRIHEKTPMKVLLKALDCVQKGGGKPQFVSDKTIYKALTGMGIPEEDVWDYAIIGCIEPSLRGGFNRCKSGHINIVKVLELAMNDGIDPITKQIVGPATGRLESFQSFDAFYKAFTTQWKQMLMILTSIHKEVTHEILRKELPHPFLSTLTRGCLAQGKDLTDMGAYWNWTSFSVTGIANVCDSLYALRHVLFEQKSVSAKELLIALASDFRGFEKLQMQLLRLAKYGNGDMRVDAMMKKVTSTLYDSAQAYRGHGDTPLCFGYVTVTKNVSMGRNVGATPDGRNAFTPFADGISPVHGCDQHGPLAILHSSESLQLYRAAEGAILNQKYLPSILNSEKAKQAFAHMIQVYLTNMKGMHIQFNMVSKGTLLEAQKHPENYRDLLVRVSGYSAYFTELSREVQQDVIERTQYEGY